MRGPTHALAGAYTAAAFLTFNIPHQYPLIALSAVAGFAALLPDLDNSESTLENLIIFNVKPFKAPAFFIDKLFKHRGFLHSLLAVLVLAFVLLGFFPNLPREIAIAVLLGYLSHIVTDGLTPLGIPLFYPLEQRVTFLPKVFCIVTGSLMEMIFFVTLGVLYLIFLNNAGYINLPS